MKLPTDDPRFLDLLAAWGTPYSWGAGSPQTARSAWPGGPKGSNGGNGWDCSGFAQAALVRLGLLPDKASDRPAATLYAAGADVTLGDERLGDLAFYGLPGHVQHVMVVVAQGVVLGARGGGSMTNANDTKAFVQIEPLKYWNLFLGVRRLPPVEATG